MIDSFRFKLRRGDKDASLDDSVSRVIGTGKTSSPLGNRLSLAELLLDDGPNRKENRSVDENRPWVLKK
jgi:hypothetical protein